MGLSRKMRQEITVQTPRLKEKLSVVAAPRLLLPGPAISSPGLAWKRPRGWDNPKQPLWTEGFQPSPSPLTRELLHLDQGVLGGRAL